MDWLTSLIDGLGSAISGAFENLWTTARISWQAYRR